MPVEQAFAKLAELEPELLDLVAEKSAAAAARHVRTNSLGSTRAPGTQSYDRT
jgi:hypothetical protein